VLLHQPDLLIGGETPLNSARRLLPQLTSSRAHSLSANPVYYSLLRVTYGFCGGPDMLPVLEGESKPGAYFQRCSRPALKSPQPPLSDPPRALFDGSGSGNAHGTVAWERRSSPG